MSDDGRMEYDDYVWDPDEAARDREAEQDRDPWRQPFAWDPRQAQPPERERDPFTDTGPLDPYPPVGGIRGGTPPPSAYDRQRPWSPPPEPPPPLPGNGGSGTNGHGNGHGGFDDTDGAGRYADFTEALIERLAEGVADPHTDPRLPRQPPAEPFAPGPGQAGQAPGRGLGADSPPIASRRSPSPPPPAAGAPPPPASEPATGPGRQPAAFGDGHQEPPAPAGPPPGSQTGPQATIPSRASRHQGRGRPGRGMGMGMRLPKPAMPRMPSWPVRPGPARGPRPATAGAAPAAAEAPGIRPGVRRGPMAVPLPGELSGIARSSLALVAVLVLAASALSGLTGALPKARPAAAPPTLDPYSQRWVCPLLTNQKASVALANTGSATATLRTTTRIGGGSAAAPNVKPITSHLPAGQTATLQATTTGQPGLVQVESFGAPVVVSAAGQPACMPGPTDDAWLSIVDLSAGASTSVVIANPDGDDAVVDLVPHLPNGILTAATQEVFVPRNSTVTTAVKFGGNIAAQGLKFALEAVARSGRVVIGAVIAQQGLPPTYVPGQSTARSSWSFAGGLSSNDQQTTLLVTNPTGNTLQVTARLIGDRGAFSLQDPAVVKPIPAGGTAQIPIQPPPTASSPASGGAFGLQVSSRDGTRFIAALRVSSKLGSGQQVAYIDAGTAFPDRSWLVPGTAAGGKVVLVNPSDRSVNAQLIPVGVKRAAGNGKGAAAAPAATTTTTLALPPDRAVVRTVPAQASALDVEADDPGVLVALLGSGGAIPSAVVGGVPAEGPVDQGPAAN